MSNTSAPSPLKADAIERLPSARTVRVSLSRAMQEVALLKKILRVAEEREELEKELSEAFQREELAHA